MPLIPSGDMQIEELRRQFEGLGLTPYAARVLVALLTVDSANSAELTRLSGVPRTSLYAVVEELVAARLVARLQGEGPAVWASTGQDAVMDRLEALQEDRLRLHRERTARARSRLEELLSADAPTMSE